MAEFLGKECLSLLLAETKVERLDDELLHRRGDLPPPCVDQQRGRLVGDEAADAAPGFDETLALEVLVNFDDCKGIDVEIGGELANGRERGAIRDLTRENALLKLLLKLEVERDAAAGRPDSVN